ncbi:MAG: hypothetical protein ACW960_09580 [Candidatus Thorarchaeota archaeon]
MSHLTAVFSPEELLKMDGIDELDTMRMEPNPFWNRPRLDITWGLPVMSIRCDSQLVMNWEYTMTLRTLKP